MLTGEESTIVTSCSAGDREPMGRAPDPANRVCTGRSVCEVLCRFLAAFQSEQLTDCSSGWLASLCAACGVSHAQESGR